MNYQRRTKAVNKRNSKLAPPTPLRSKIMSAIKSYGNRSTELSMLSILKHYKLNGWRRHLAIKGTPDFSFPKLRIAIFVDGCFWHGCTKCSRFKVKSNADFWGKKIEKNIKRDTSISRLLRKQGWAVLRFWEHSLSNEQSVAKRIISKIHERELIRLGKLRP